MSHRALSAAELNRTLLARQGLLRRWEGREVTDAVESLGAIQSQNWAAPPVALWSRLGGFDPAHLYRAFADGLLATGTLLRRTLHTVSVRQHPEYAAVSEACGANDWRRTKEPLAAEDALALRAALVEHARTPRGGGELTAFLEQWVADHPGALAVAEEAAQREKEWRPVRGTSDLVRVPADGIWGAKAPKSLQAAPCPPFAPGAPDPDEALRSLVRRHLAAFGPAGGDDIAYWLGARTTDVRRVLKEFGDELATFTDPSGRVLHDLAELETADPDVPAPVRFLPSFDSALLAYAPTNRQRILPDAYRDLVYVRANLQVKPTVLVDGMVAGIWEVGTARRETTVTVRSFGPLPAQARKDITAEGEALARFLGPRAATHHVTVVDAT